jgi:hypothetical protein
MTQTYYFNRLGGRAVLRFTPDPDDANDDERRDGVMVRDCRMDADYYDPATGRTVRKSKVFAFSVKLSTEKTIRRVQPSLGKLLGMTPKGM